MAKIQEEYLVIKISKLIKDTDATAPALGAEEKEALCNMVAEALPGYIVEVAEGA